MQQDFPAMTMNNNLHISMLAVCLVPPTVTDTGGKYAKDSWSCLRALVWLKGYITGEQKTPPPLEQVNGQHKWIFAHPSLCRTHNLDLTHQQFPLFTKYDSNNVIVNTARWHTFNNRYTLFWGQAREAHGISSIHLTFAKSSVCVLSFTCTNTRRKPFKGNVHTTCAHWAWVLWITPTCPLKHTNKPREVWATEVKITR